MATSKNAILLVIIAAFLMAASGIAFKFSSINISLKNPINIEFALGFLILTIAAFVYIKALKGGELSVLYPILASSYIWIAVFSPLIFPSDSLNLVKIAGMVIIIGGIYCIGRGSTA